MRLRMMCDGGGTVISIKLVQPQPVIRSSANTATGHTLDTLEAIIESNSHAIQATTTRQQNSHPKGSNATVSTANKYHIYDFQS